jgi:hypothetical protein
MVRRMAENNVNAAADLATLWTTNASRFHQSRALIEECSQWALQQRAPIVPTTDGRRQGFAVQLPHTTTMPNDVASFVARRQPSLTRTPLGSGSRAARTASDVENWLQEAMRSKVLIDGEPFWETVVAHLVSDAEVAVLVQPAPSHYSGLLELFDEDGSIRGEWQRNKDGLDVDEYTAKTGSKKGYGVSTRKSTDAHKSYSTSYKARRWPFLVRVLGAAEYLPLGRDQISGRLDTLLIRSVCSTTHLKTQGFDWWTTSGGGSRESNVQSSGKTYWLYELHSSMPWTITYQIVGMDGTKYQATMNGEADQLGIDMEKEFGLRQLPAGLYYGWHRAQDKNPATRGIPLLAPFLGIIGAANRSLAGVVEHNYRTGYGGWGVELNPAFLEQWVEMGRPQQFDIKDDATHILLGKPSSLVHGGVGQDAWKILEYLSGLVERFNESERVRTSADSSSIAQTTSLASADTILSQITNGALQAYQLVAEALLEQCAALSEATGGPIPVYCHVVADGSEQTHVELSAKDLLGDFRVDVEQPTQKGSNLPKAQAGVGWQQMGLIGKAEWRQDFYGDPQPEAALDTIAAEAYVDSPDGQKELQMLIARIQGDQDAQKIKGMQDQGTLSPGGTPTAAIPDQPPGGPAPPQPGIGPGGVPMPQQPNVAASALGGMTAAAVNPGEVTKVVQGTGVGPEMSSP